MLDKLPPLDQLQMPSFSFSLQDLQTALNDLPAALNGTFSRFDAHDLCSPSPSTLAYTILALGATLALRSIVNARRLRRQMPPGPPGIPFLGNALQVPTAFTWFKFTEWKQQYGQYSPIPR